MRKVYRKLADGELSNASRRRKDGTYVHAIKCCDCGLEHILQYELTKAASLRFRAWRLNSGKTTKARRTKRVSDK